MATTDPDCLFCKIVSGEIAGDIVLRTDRIVAFRDIAPAAPVHVLVVPVDHARNAAATADADPALVGELVLAARRVALDTGCDTSVGGAGYRLVFNTDAGAQQTVFHTHLHLLGGRDLTWPPG